MCPINEDKAPSVSDYDDEVTQDDIDQLQAHAAEHFGTPEFVKSSEAAW